MGCNAENKLSSTDKLITYFNSKGRWQRFQNSSLIFGENLTTEVGKSLQFKPDNLKNTYRKVAHVFDTDSSITYFMYGLASSDSVLSELRVRSLRNADVVDDNLILQYSGENQLYHDYWFNENMMILYSRKSEHLTHYSYFLFEDGEVINKTLIPDTVFQVHRLLPEPGQRVKLSDGYYTTETRENKKETIATGRITKVFGGGKSCRTYMMIELDVPFQGYNFIQVNFSINSYTSVHGLLNDSLELRPIRCFEPSEWPIRDPVFLKKNIYIEYQ